MDNGRMPDPLDFKPKPLETPTHLSDSTSTPVDKVYTEVTEPTTEKDSALRRLLIVFAATFFITFMTVSDGNTLAGAISAELMRPVSIFLLIVSFLYGFYYLLNVHALGLVKKNDIWIVVIGLMALGIQLFVVRMQ